MRWSRILTTIMLFLVVLAGLTVLAGATTLVRGGLETLTAENDLIVLGRVLDLHSYWNAGRTHILTDLRVRVEEVLKGTPSATEVTLRLLGGTVGEWSTLLVGGPELVPGSEYVLFLSRREILPGTGEAYMIPDHIQGVFDVVSAAGASSKAGPGGRNAVSQGNRHPLLPDEKGIAEPAGGAEGLPLEELIRQVRELAQ